jgi:D-lyxose ketol-isomerase
VKRSEVNRVIANARAVFAGSLIHLPPFASWQPSDWDRDHRVALELMRAGLGWDVIEWQAGSFSKHGLVLFTLRNVSQAAEPGQEGGYAEKLLLVRASQRTPFHAHRRKMEDIINRGGGNLIIDLRAGSPGSHGSYVLVNGVCKPLAHDVETVALSPGESITLLPGVIHAFCAAGDDVIAGEVSTHNDDASDNFFLEPAERFPRFEEDVPAEHLVVADYPWLMAKWA